MQLTSYGYDLDQYPITNDSDETTVAYSSEDPSDIALDAMDRFVAALQVRATILTHWPQAPAYRDWYNCFIYF